jgi:hypothetical protein
MFACFLKWLVLIPIELSSSIIAKALCPILPFFVDPKTNRLPDWLSWFRTLHCDADGDPDHRAKHPGTGFFATWWRRTTWLWRNSAYGFSLSVLGVQTRPFDFLKTVGNPEAGDSVRIPGYCNRYLYRNKKLLAFHWYGVWFYHVLSYEGCIRWSFGWKLWNRLGEVAQFHCYFNPFKAIRRVDR